MVERVAAVGRIGPNAVSRVLEALQSGEGYETTNRVFREAKLASYLAQPPDSMVPEQEVARLHQALIGCVGPARARAISRDAGQLTAEYLLENRIPAWLQPLLRLLPAALSGRALLRAISKNSWTFSGSARFSFTSRPAWAISLEGCPLCARMHTDVPACDYYATTFEHLFRELVSPGARVLEVECQAAGARACVFSIQV